ncbi:SDR family oxidoreductase [Streptomyces sp. NPDC096013]|uniref:SDR family oxidoreductase n=1 Tax=Streptomyces sp. NPDC096013 TaxID=3366069 RepID=UPI003824EBD2
MRSCSPADVSSGDSVRAAFAQVEERFGRVDILVNSAGVARIRAIEETADDDIHTCIGTNLLRPIHTVGSAVPLLRAAGGGDILNISFENFSGEDRQRAAPVWEADGYPARVGALKPLPSATVAGDGPAARHTAGGRGRPGRGAHPPGGLRPGGPPRACETRANHASAFDTP